MPTTYWPLSPADEAHVVFILPAYVSTREACGCLDVLAWVMGEGGAAFGELLQGIEILARKRGFVANGTPLN